MEKYRLPNSVSFKDDTVYNACNHIRYVVNNECEKKYKNNCDICLYRNSFKACIKDIVIEIKKNIEKKIWR
jgi:hypothetical protein